MFIEMLHNVWHDQQAVYMQLDITCMCNINVTNVGTYLYLCKVFIYQRECIDAYIQARYHVD